jgi:hypothetical protein
MEFRLCMIYCINWRREALNRPLLLLSHSNLVDCSTCEVIADASTEISFTIWRKLQQQLFLLRCSSSRKDWCRPCAWRRSVGVDWKPQTGEYSHPVTLLFADFLCSWYAVLVVTTVRLDRRVCKKMYLSIRMFFWHQFFDWNRHSFFCVTTRLVRCFRIYFKLF